MKIYTTVEPVPSRMVALARLLLSAGPLHEDELVSLLQPRENTGIAANTLSAALECGLVVREKRQCRLAEGLFVDRPKPADLDTELPVVLTRLLLKPKVGSEANGFAILCAWLLQQPALSTPVDRVGLKTTLQAQGLSLADLQVQNDARLDNVVYWARYLGLVRQIKDEPCAGLVPDPSLFLKRHLAQLLPAGEEVQAHMFRQRLGDVCPVLDGGVVREKLLPQLAPDWPEQQISDALSFAILRLEKNGDLRAWCPDDQRQFLLTPPPLARKIGFLARVK